MKICHVALFTNNLETMKDFYLRYFQGTSNNLYSNPSKGFSSYFIKFDSGAAIEIMSKNEGLSEKDGGKPQTGYAHIAFCVQNRDAVNGLTKILREDGYKVLSEPRVTGDGYYESCILDPDGNQVEITC